MAHPRPRTLVLLALLVVALLLLTYAFEVRTDQSQPGARAVDIHRGLYTSIGFEFDWESGAAPDASPVSRLLDFAHRYSGKATFADSSGGAFAAQGKTCYTTEEAEALADAHRDRHSFPTLSIWVHYTLLNGLNCGNAQIAAQTYRATSVVVYVPALRMDQVAVAAAMAHEFGHVMGLCAISMPDISPPVCDGNGHALDSSSLMASSLNLASPWVQDLQLQPGEVKLLNEL